MEEYSTSQQNKANEEEANVQDESDDDVVTKKVDSPRDCLAFRWLKSI